MVVLPLPVGPAHSTMPNGASDDLRDRSRGCRRACRGRRGAAPSGSCRGSACTHFSPQMVAAVATRTSMSLPSISVVSWPSWGRRRSTMFMPAMILIRLTRPTPMAAGSMRTSLSAPSMRKRTRTTSWDGSMCTSEARSRLAWVRIRLTTCTIGASSATTSVSSVFAVAALAGGALDRLERLDEPVHAADGPVAAVDGPLDVGLGGASTRRIGWSLDCMRSARTATDGWSATATCEAVVVQTDRHGHVLAHDLLGNERQRLGVGLVAPDVDDGHVQEVGQDQDELPLVQRRPSRRGSRRSVCPSGPGRPAPARCRPR